MDDPPRSQVPDLPELCDMCHRSISNSSALYGMVADSSWVHPTAASVY